MKLALHRSISFWSGILVMVFICWAWWDSTRNSTILAHADYIAINAGSGFSVSHNVGLGISAEFQHGPLDGEATSLRTVGLRWPLYLQNAGEGNQAMMDRFWRGKDGEDPLSPLLYLTMFGQRGDWVCYLPHWLLLLLAAIPWSALLLWRVRRRNRAAVVPA